MVVLSDSVHVPKDTDWTARLIGQESRDRQVYAV